MEPQEIDSALDELENRLDRLRSLYEQYFMGIEKIEPTVPRKDVDRRFWILRRTPIRNTARRFRLQTLTQRYNTFQQHWTRICREIENGTYVRHLLKAQKNLGAEPKTWAAKKRLGLLRRDRSDSTAPPADSAPPSAAGADGFASRPPPSVGTASRPSVAPSASSPLAPPRPSQPPDLGRLDLDFDEAPTLPPPPGGFRSAVRAAPAPVANPAQSSNAAAARGPATAPDAPKRLSPIPLPGGRARPPSAVPRPPGLPQVTTPMDATSRPAPKPAAAAPAVAAAVKAPAAAQPIVKPPASAGAAPSSAKPVAAAAATAKPAAAPAVPIAKPAATAPVSAPRPAAPAAAIPGAKPAVTAPVTKPAAPAATPAGLSDERVRQLHADLATARQKLNQTSTISVDSLAKSLRETEAKLRAQHGGRAVDFQVVIKDGKPIVKPVVRR